MLFVGLKHWTFLNANISGSWVGDQPWLSLLDLLGQYQAKQVDLVLSPQWFVFLRIGNQSTNLPSEVAFKTLGLAPGKWRLIIRTVSGNHFIAALKADQFTAMTTVSQQFPKIRWHLVPLILAQESLPNQPWQCNKEFQLFAFDEHGLVTQWYGSPPVFSSNQWWQWLTHLQIQDWLIFKSGPQMLYQKLGYWSHCLRKACKAALLLACLFWSVWLGMKQVASIPSVQSQTNTPPPQEATNLRERVTALGVQLQTWQQASRKHRPLANLATRLANQTHGHIRWLESSWEGNSFQLVFEAADMETALAYADRLRALPETKHIRLASLNRTNNAPFARFQLWGTSS